MKPLGKVRIRWSPDFAYAIGLLVTDGCLSSDKRHIILTSKDREMIENFKTCLAVQNKISNHRSGAGTYGFRIQFGDVLFYDFLNRIGLSSRKSKILPRIDVPREYFFDFLRGHFDGDGCFYSYWDSRWRSSFMYYTTFNSASEKHLLWLRAEISAEAGVHGHMIKTGKTPMYTLRYAKAESLKLLPRMYYNADVVCLSRKRKKIVSALTVIGERLTK